MKNNRLSGPIPDAFSKFPGITHLMLGGNAISGSIPEGISQLQTLRHLDLSDSQIGGNLTEIFKLKHLTFFNVNNTKVRLDRIIREWVECSTPVD